MEPAKLWIWLPLPVDNEDRQLFAAWVTITDGDGATACFWHEAWLLDQPVKVRMPDLFSACTSG